MMERFYRIRNCLRKQAAEDALLLWTVCILAVITWIWILVAVVFL